MKEHELKILQEKEYEKEEKEIREMTIFIVILGLLFGFGVSLLIFSEQIAFIILGMGN